MDLVQRTIIQTTSSQQDKLVAMRKFMFFLKEKQIISSKTFKKISKLKMRNLKTPKALITPAKKKKWTILPERYQEVYDQLVTNSKTMVAWLGFNFGLRVGEICHLKISDIEFYDITSHIRGKLFIRPDLESGWNPKTESSIRSLGITPTQEQILKHFIQKRNEFLAREFPDCAHDYLIFSKMDGYNVLENTVFRWLQEVTLDFEVNGQKFTKTLRPHVLRYSFATNCYFNTRRIYEVSKLLGHSSIKQTEDYLALGEEELFNNMYDVMLQAGL